MVAAAFFASARRVHVDRHTKEEPMTRFIAIALTAMLFSTTAMARPGGGPPPPGIVVEQNAQELGLSETEVQSMRAVFDNNRETMRAMMEEMRAAKDAEDHASMRALHQEVKQMREAILEEALATLPADKASTVRSFFQERRDEGPPRRGQRPQQ